jgi:parallel beta-helix repeat protein
MNTTYRKCIVFATIFIFIGATILNAIGNTRLEGKKNIKDPKKSVHFQKTIYVDDNNTQGPWEGTREHPYQYIQDGIDHVKDGDTVYVFSGVYNEKLRIEKSINLIGENRDATIIDGKGRAGWGLVLYADSIIISNFTIRNHFGRWNEGGILLNTNHCNISSCIVMKNLRGIEIRGSNNIVRDCYIFENLFQTSTIRLYGYGAITINNGDYNLIDKCIVYNNNPTIENVLDWGIKLVYFAENNIITRCTIVYHKGRGITTYSNCSNNVIFNNNFILNNPNAVEGKYCNNKWDYQGIGNYWHDYLEHCPDAKRINGVWEKPYPVSSNNYDNFPLVNITYFDYKDIPHFFPIAFFIHEPSHPLINEKIKFDATYSFDFDDIVLYEWDFGDGTIKTGKILSHSYEVEGEYNVTLSVITEHGMDNVTKKIIVSSCGCSVVNLNTSETFDNIQSAIDDRDTRDKALLLVSKEQTCYENVVIHKSIHLIGEDRNSTVIDGREKGPVITVTIPKVNISGFTIRNGSKGILVKIHWFIAQSDYIAISKNIIVDNSDGIYLDTSNYNTINENKIYSNSKQGIFLHNSHHNTISKNKISNSNKGIYAYYSESNLILKNTIDSKVGIHLLRGDFNFVSENKISNNNLGIWIDGWENKITENTISKNELGVRLDWGKRNFISKNNFIENPEHAVFRYSGLIILFPPVFLLYHGNIWKANYWDDWTGFGPKIIYGTFEILFFRNLYDISGRDINLRWMNFDWFPAREPYEVL